MMSFALLFAFLAPVFFALSNVVDKYIIGRHVKDVLAFTSVTGIISIVAAGIAAFFLDWSTMSSMSAFVAIVIGMSMGLQFFFYMTVLEKEDVSHMIGLAFVYPLIVALLAYVFLLERVSLLAYIGMAITIVGVLFLSLRLRKLSLRASIWAIVAVILLAGIGEFLMKVSTTMMGVWQAIVLSTAATGVTLLCGLFFKRIRKNARSELRNIGWCALSDVTLFLAIGTGFLAMNGLPATIVSSIAAIQPLAVLVMEYFIHLRTGNMSRDSALLPKLGAITLIVVGVALLSFAA